MISYKKIFFVYFLVLLTSSPLYSLDDECDILCRAGVKPQENSQNKPKPKPEIKKKTYVKPRSYSSYGQSSLIINSTESTKRDIADIKNWIYKNVPELSREPYDIEVGLTSSFGVKDNFNIGNLNISVIEKDNAKKYGIVNFGSIACNGSVMGYGVNEAKPFEMMFKMVEFPKPLSSSDFYSCKFEDIELDLNGIAEFNGESKEFLVDELEYEIGKQPAEIFIALLENMDLYFDYGGTYNQNLWRYSNKNIFSFDNSSISILFDVEAETDMSIIYDVFSEAKIFLNSVVGRQMMNDLANASEVLPLDEYLKIGMKIFESQYEDSFYEAAERLQNSMVNLGIDFETGTSDEIYQKIYKLSFGINWSDEMFRKIAYASGGTIDAGLLVSKGLIANKMNKYEIQMLLQNAGLDRNLQGLYLDYAYTLYDQFYEQAKIFINNPRGILFELEFPLGLDQQILYEIEQNPMMAFNVLNNMEFKITANPIFRN